MNYVLDCLSFLSFRSKKWFNLDFFIFFFHQGNTKCGKWEQGYNKTFITITRTHCKSIRGRESVFSTKVTFFCLFVFLSVCLIGLIGQILGLRGRILGLRGRISGLKGWIWGLREQISGLRGLIGGMNRWMDGLTNKGPLCSTGL